MAPLLDKPVIDWNYLKKYMCHILLTIHAAFFLSKNSFLFMLYFGIVIFWLGKKNCYEKWKYFLKHSMLIWTLLAATNMVGPLETPNQVLVFEIYLSYMAVFATLFFLVDVFETCYKNLQKIQKTWCQLFCICPCSQTYI